MIRFMSAPVYTAVTPGWASAADTSIDAIAACGIGLRRKWAWRQPGGLTSAT